MQAAEPQCQRPQPRQYVSQPRWPQ